MKIKSILKIEMYHINTGVAWLSRVISVVFSIFTLRINMEFLSSKEFALFAFLTSLMGWFGVLDFGSNEKFRHQANS